jgi:ribosomal protein L40E
VPKKVTKRTKSKASSTAKQPPKVCDSCGAENALEAEECAACDKSRFAPTWVSALRPVSRFFKVQVTQPSPESLSQDPRITLYKWWPGAERAQSVNINRAGDWERIKEIIDTDLAELLGWSSRTEIAVEIEARRKEQASFDAKAQAILGANPEMLVKIAEGLKLESIDAEERPGSPTRSAR